MIWLAEDWMNIGKLWSKERLGKKRALVFSAF